MMVLADEMTTQYAISSLAAWCRFISTVHWLLSSHIKLQFNAFYFLSFYALAYTVTPRRNAVREHQFQHSIDEIPRWVNNLDLTCISFYTPWLKAR
jgi:hypothetical protein